MSRRGLMLAGGAALAATLGGVAVGRRAGAREAAAEAAFPPEGRILDVGGIPVHAVIRGRGPDLVMLHGAGGNSRDFTHRLVGRLADRYRCIVFDRPGLGYTGRTDPAYDSVCTGRAESPGEQAGLLAAAHAQLSDDTPLVLGHSYGGTVALAWGLDHPARALVLLSPVAMRWEDGLGPVHAVNASPLGGGLAVPLVTAFLPREQLRAITQAIFAPDPVPAGYLEHIGAELTLRRASLRANARQVSGLKAHVTRMQARYPEFRLPIEWLHGTADRIVPATAHARPFADLVPQTRLTLLDGRGHMPHHACPRAAVDAVDRAAARAA